MADSGAVPRVPLADGATMPQVGFGVWQVPPAETQEVVEEAFRTGYRHVDTAAAYGNEEGVGAAVRASGLPREELFVTTKLWNSDQGYDAALRAFEGSRARLGLDFVDLYLIHWPLPGRDRFVGTWRALERIQEEGGTRSIGVSNFRIEDVERLEREGAARPVVNQVELHPRLQQPELRTWHAERGIVTEAWSPLAKGGDLLADPTIGAIAAAHGRTPAQAILRWHLQLGNVVIPKSVRPARMAENLDLFGFELGAEEMAAIGRLDAGERTGPDPGRFDLA